MASPARRLRPAGGSAVWYGSTGLAGAPVALVAGRLPLEASPSTKLVRSSSILLESASFRKCVEKLTLTQESCSLLVVTKISAAALDPSSLSEGRHYPPSINVADRLEDLILL